MKLNKINIKLIMLQTISTVFIVSCAPTAVDSATTEFRVSGEQAMTIDAFRASETAKKLANVTTCSSHLGQNSALMIEAGGAKNTMGNALLKCDSAGNCSQVGYTTTQWGLDAPGTMNIKAEAEMYCTLIGREIGVLARPTMASALGNAELRVSKISNMSASLRGESRNLSDVFRVYMVNQNQQTGAKKVIDIFFQDTAKGIELIGAATKQDQISGAQSDTSKTAIYSEVHFLSDATGLGDEVQGISHNSSGFSQWGF